MRRALGVVLVAVWAGCAHAPPSAGPSIDKVEIVGAKAVSKKEIEKKILTSQRSWIPFSRKPRFDPNLWRQDLQRIERLYRSRGFFEAKVLDANVDPKGPDHVVLNVRISEGAPTKVAEVNVTGLDDLPEPQRKAALGAVTLTPGAPFDEGKWTALEGAVQSALVNQGYAEAKVKADATVDVATHTARIVVTTTPGERYRIGPVHVEASNKGRVPAWRIEEQVKEAVEDRAWYSQELRDEAQQRVFAMGVFGAAEVKPGPPDREHGVLPLDVAVSEAPFHEVSGGAGVGIQTLRNDAHLVGRYSNRDFFGGLRHLDFNAKIGWAFVPNAYTALSGGDAVVRQGPIAKITNELTQPRLFHPDLGVFNRLEVEKGIEPAYEFIGGRVKVGVPWKPQPWITVQPSYNLEAYRLSVGQTELGGEAPLLLFGCNGTCVLSYLEQTVSYDRRDDPREPKKGVYTALGLQEGGGPLGGTFDYLRVIPELRGYQSVLPGRKLTFAGRLRLGTLLPFHGGTFDSPIVARFFSGGDQMRGFSSRRLSPMRLVEKRTNPNTLTPSTSGDAEPVPIGGNSLLEASLETRYQLTQKLIGAVFLDGGNVRSESLHLQDLPDFVTELYLALGTGIRYRTPVGPVRLEVAYRLPTGPTLQVYQPTGGNLSYVPSAGCFGIGKGKPSAGAPESVCSLHLSIGEAF